LSASSTYYYRIRSYNAGGNSGYSNVASTATYPAPVINAPSSLTATAVSSSTINLAWTDNSNNETGFQIWRSTVSGTSYSQIGTVSANVVTYTDPSLSASSTYFYVVRATNTVWSSNFSNEASTITYPAAQSINAPSNLIATAVSSSTINIAWMDNSNNETGFKIERKLATGTYAQITTVGANFTTYADTGLSAGTAYYYRIRAANASGDSGYSNEVSTTTFSAISGDTKIMDKISSGGIIVIGSTKNSGVINPDQGDTAKIYFKGPQTGEYECRIFTLTGELVWQDTQENVSSGMFEWIPQNIASGGYVACVTGPGLNVKKKIAVLR
jgi:Fibronectin type III domain